MQQPHTQEFPKGGQASLFFPPSPLSHTYTFYSMWKVSEKLIHKTALFTHCGWIFWAVKIMWKNHVWWTGQFQITIANLTWILWKWDIFEGIINILPQCVLYNVTYLNKCVGDLKSFCVIKQYFRIWLNPIFDLCSVVGTCKISSGYGITQLLFPVVKKSAVW